MIVRPAKPLAFRPTAHLGLDLRTLPNSEASRLQLFPRPEVGYADAQGDADAVSRVRALPTTSSGAPQLLPCKTCSVGCAPCEREIRRFPAQIKMRRVVDPPHIESEELN